jgi:hypothetical protein
MGRTREDSPEGRDSPQTKDPTHIRHGRGVTRTVQLLPIQARSTRAGVQSGRVVTPGPADDTYPTDPEQPNLGTPRGESAPGPEPRVEALEGAAAGGGQSGHGASDRARWRDGGFARIHPGTPGGSRLAGGNQAQVPGGGGPAVRNFEAHSDPAGPAQRETAEPAARPATVRARRPGSARDGPSPPPSALAHL